MLWTIDGSLIVDASGHPVICDECPCGGEQECSERLDARRLELLSDPRYRFVQEATAHYNCHEQSDSESYDAGTLVVLMARDETFHTPYLYAVHAFEFEEIATGTHRTIACLCSCGSDWTYVEANAYGIAMVVEADDSQECRPADMCEVYKGEIDYFASWHGGQVYGEGFYDWVSDHFNFQPFRKAVVFEPDESDSTAPTTQKIAYIECQCTGRASSMWKGGEISVHDIPGFCDEPCQQLVALRAEAIDKGWTWHDGGYILVYPYWVEQDTETWDMIYHVCDTYREIETPCMGCADDGQNLHYVTCWCEVYTVSKTQVDEMTGYTYIDFRDYLDYTWACQCGMRARRELYIQYPEVFGIVQLGFSSDMKFQYSEDYYDDFEGTTTTTTGVTTVASKIGGITDYIDYRMMVCVRLRCQGGWRVCVYNDVDSPWSDECWDYPDHQPVLLGPRVPFGVDPDVGNRNGHVVAWWTNRSENGVNCGYGSREEAQSDYDRHGHPSPPPPEGLSDYAQEAHASLMEPDIQFEHHTGGVSENWWSWCVQPDWWTPTGGMPDYHYYGTAVYYVNYLCTNMGFLVNGLPDDEQYSETLTILGIGAYGGKDLYDHDGVPYDDETRTCTRHGWTWCDPDFELPDESESVSESQSESMGE